MVSGNHEREAVHTSRDSQFSWAQLILRYHANGKQTYKIKYTQRKTDCIRMQNIKKRSKINHDLESYGK